MRHIIESQQFSRDFLEKIFKRARYFEKNGGGDVLRGRLMASLFYEPSTRTRLSFESAMLRLGGQVVSTENARDFSSAIKGETLEDSIRVVSQYVDVVVLRHFENDASERAVKVSRVPIVNAGSGSGQHPTQAVLDAYSIWRERGGIDGLTIAFAGDLKYGRTVRSLSYLLGKFKKIKIIFVSPPEISIADDILAYLKKHKVEYEKAERIEEVIGRVDVWYQTRIQKERFTDLKLYERIKGVYRLTKKHAQKMKKGAVIMHPLPRVDEISKDVDDLPSAGYFRQAGYGLYVRMALLEYVVSK